MSVLWLKGTIYLAKVQGYEKKNRKHANVRGSKALPDSGTETRCRVRTGRRAVQVPTPLSEKKAKRYTQEKDPEKGGS